MLIQPNRRTLSMPRTARILLPHTAHHVVQRGHNRANVFAARDDYRRYLDTLCEWKAELDIKVYGYCLMTNHVHLLLEPGEDVHTVGKLMRRLAGRQTRYVNAVEGRTGTLWDGRYKASPIQTESYLLACSRYVELNPVRARMVDTPQAYPWSSYRTKAGEYEWDWLDEDPCYTELADSPKERARRYVAFVASEISEKEYTIIREAVRRNQLTGDARFVDEVARRIGRRIELRGRGRPRGRGEEPVPSPDV